MSLCSCACSRAMRFMADAWRAMLASCGLTAPNTAATSLVTAGGVEERVEEEEEVRVEETAAGSGEEEEEAVAVGLKYLCSVLNTVRPFLAGGADGGGAGFAPSRRGLRRLPFR